MSEYLIQSETLTSLGDEVRVLGETEDRKSPVEMTSVVNTANGVISSQGTLIQEIIEELEGKIAGGGQALGGEFNLVSTLNSDGTQNLAAVSAEVIEEYNGEVE